MPTDAATVAAAPAGVCAAQPVVVVEVVGNGAVLARVTDHGRSVLPKGLHEFPANPTLGSREALLTTIRDVLMEHGLSYTEDLGTGERFPLVDKLCAPNDQTTQTGEDEIAILAETILDVIPDYAAPAEKLQRSVTWDELRHSLALLFCGLTGRKVTSIESRLDEAARDSAWQGLASREESNAG
ncbi:MULTISPECIES: hypothetical protein [unclassified Cupriavidus]|uniref:hypothetical protein n=1 Tax=unclassified Cupriavidus TaxID=2640874 RepID=UPI001AE75565|nr:MULTISPECIES: hypothetical protein [unclassified Cupriavidus]MBP0633687.1 hypothetical protein [Cupriavidus sp. AcVe19-1a]MBP0639936.1 hypothetical protein [Cupriavidus sp. AcVe19-6a]